jgi:hypothetical protein
LARDVSPLGPEREGAAALAARAGSEAAASGCF